MDDILLSKGYKQFCDLLKKQDGIVHEGWERALKTIAQKDSRDLEGLKKYITFPVSKNTEAAIKQIDLLKSFIGDSKIQSVLEMGAGYGNLCRVMNLYSKDLEYTILDLEGMIRFSKQFLDDHNIKCNFVEVKSCQDIFNKTYDLFVANNCLSETPTHFMELFLSVLLKNKKAQNVFIVDSYIDYLEKELKSNFNNVSILPYYKKGEQFIHIWLTV